MPIALAILFALIIQDANPMTLWHLIDQWPTYLIACWLPPLIALGFHHVRAHKTIQQFNTSHALQALKRHQQLSELTQYVMLLCWLTPLILGAPDWITTNLPLLPSDLYLLLPIILYGIGQLWLNDPLDQLVLGSQMLRQIDQGQLPISNTSRLDNVWFKIRLSCVLSILPACLLYFAIQLAQTYTPASWIQIKSLNQNNASWITKIWTLSIAWLAHAISPLLIRLFLSTQPLTQELLPKSLQPILRKQTSHKRSNSHRIYLWPTGNRLNNAVALHGIFSNAVLLTDRLIQQLPAQQTAGVIAHELGHLQFKHASRCLSCAIFGGLLFFATTQLVLPAITSNTNPQETHLISLLTAIFAGFAIWTQTIRIAEKEADRYAVELLTTCLTFTQAKQAVYQAVKIVHPETSSFSLFYPPKAVRLKRIEQLKPISALQSPPQPQLQPQPSQLVQIKLDALQTPNTITPTKLKPLSRTLILLSIAAYMLQQMLQTMS